MSKKDPGSVKLKHLHAWLTIFWVLNFPAVTILYFFFPVLWGKISIFYLVLVSIYANVGTEGGAWQASRAEVKVDNIDTETLSAKEIDTKKLKVKK